MSTTGHSLICQVQGFANDSISSQTAEGALKSISHHFFLACNNATTRWPHTHSNTNMQHILSQWRKAVSKVSDMSSWRPQSHWLPQQLLRHFHPPPLLLADGHPRCCHARPQQRSRWTRRRFHSSASSHASLERDPSSGWCNLVSPRWLWAPFL